MKRLPFYGLALMHMTTVKDGGFPFWIKKYKADKELLLQKEIPLTGHSIALNITIGSLMAGQAFKCNDIAEILEYEKNVKESCKIFKNYLEVMRHFGGEEVIEY